MSKPQTSIAFWRLFLPHPLSAAQVAAFFTALISGMSGQTVVLETRADQHGMVHLLGTEPGFHHTVGRLLSDLIPGSLLVDVERSIRSSIHTAATLKTKPASLPLAIADPERVVRAIYSAFNRRFAQDETLALQVVIGNGAAPSRIPPKVADPNANSPWQALTRGTAMAPTEVRSKLRDRAAEYQAEVIVRVGVAAADARKRRRMALDVLAGMRTAQAPGAKLNLAPGDPNPFDRPGRPRRFTQRLAVSELVALSGWPVGTEPLPGMPPAHPKLLRAAPNTTDGPLVVAESLIPGDRRLLGMTITAARYHGFIMGPTGSGKTELLEGLQIEAANQGHAVLAMDPKAQSADSILERINPERWKDVYEINAAHAEPNGINLFDPGDGDPDVQADTILAVFEKSFDYLGPRTSDVLSASVRTLIRAGTPEEPSTILDIPPLLTDPAFRRERVAKVQNDPFIAGFWAWYESQSAGQQMQVIAPVMNRLRKILLRPGAVKILGQRKPAFRLRNLFREGKIVLVPLNEALIGPLTCDLIGGLVMAEVWQAAQERAAEPSHENNPGFVFVDEADRFMSGGLSVNLGDALARSRSLSVGWFLATQYWKQLPEEMKSAVKSNARNKVVFRLEDDDDARTFANLAPELEPLDFMSLGKYEVYTRLVVDGVTTSWALGKTREAVPARHSASEVRRIAKAHHPTSLIPAATILATTSDEEPPPLDDPPSDHGAGPVGRRRRHS